MAKDSLALEMTADPAEFAEACGEFASRRVISRTEADKLSGYARKHAWWISGVAQMDVANDAHRSILESMRDGTPFEEWKKTAGAAIEREWGRKDSNRLLLIYRNATTSAYNAGRLEQMEQPHVTAVRPYKMLDVVDDDRTSAICRGFLSPEVVLPWDDPWWLTHSPPFHHLCRTGIRSLRKQVAERIGISAEPPTVKIDPGWGLHPKYSEPPKPSERKIQPDPELHFEAMVKASKDARKRKPVEIKQKAEHTPEHWEKHYAAKYGDAAKQVAYGRALLERAKDMSAKEALDIVQKLEAAKVPGVPAMAVDWLEKAARFPKRAAVDKVLLEHIDSVKLLAQVAKIHGSPVVALGNVPNEINYAATKAQQWYATFASAKLPIPQVKWKILPESRKGRAFCDVLDGAGAPHLDGNNAPWSAVHEWAHAIEYNGKLGAKVNAFRRAREAGQTPRLLRDITGGSSYGDNERAIEDKYWNPYMGKDYGDPNVSEVVSQLFGDLAGNQIASMTKKDPESLFFALGILGGV